MHRRDRQLLVMSLEPRQLKREYLYAAERNHADEKCPLAPYPDVQIELRLTERRVNNHW
jgi:hypothetical protein